MPWGREAGTVARWASGTVERENEYLIALRSTLTLELRGKRVNLC